MNTKQILSVVFLLITSINFSQEDDKPPRIKEENVVVNASKFQYVFNKKKLEIIDTIDNPIKRYLDDIKELRNNGNNVLYSGRSLNYFFSKKLETNFKTSNDLSLQETYFNIDPTDKSLSLGYNFDNRFGDPLKKINWVASLGAKFVASDGFAAIPLGNSAKKSNLGFNLKFSLIGKGVLKWKSNGVDRRQSIRKLKELKMSDIENIDSVIQIHREYLNYSYNEKVNDFNDKELKKIVAIIDARYPKDSIELKKKKIAEKVEEKSDELFYEMIKEEITYVEDNELYSSIKNHWTTFELYIPFGDKTYNITPITILNEATTAAYYPLNFNTSYNWYIQKSKNFSFFGKITGGYKRNNNIEVNSLEEKEFQHITTANGVSTLSTPVKAIELSQYNKFTTTSLKVEFAVFLINNTVGFSPSIEKNFGDFEGINWKLGVPLSLKDKEGKPKVNFELQWKENQTLVKSIHSVGISTSLFFGDLMK